MVVSLLSSLDYVLYGLKWALDIISDLVERDTKEALLHISSCSAGVVYKPQLVLAFLVQCGRRYEFISHLLQV